MKTRTIFLTLILGLGPIGAHLGCDEHKYDDQLAEAAAAASAKAAASAAMSALASSVASAPPAPTFARKSAADCKPHPATIDFTDQPGLEKEVRKKASKDTGPITPADLAKITSVNLVTAKIHQIDPCIFPMFTSLKGCFLGAGDYDDLTPLQKLTSLVDLNLSTSQVKDLHAIEGLKNLDRLDLSN